MKKKNKLAYTNIEIENSIKNMAKNKTNDMDLLFSELLILVLEEVSYCLEIY